MVYSGEVVDEGVGVDCPWDSFLEYRDKDMESQYLRMQHDYWRTVDCATYYLIIAGGLSWMLLSESESLGYVGWGDRVAGALLSFRGWLLLSPLMAGLLIWCCKKSVGPYRDYEVGLSWVQDCAFFCGGSSGSC